MDLMQQAKHLIEIAIQDIELKTKGELDFNIKQQIALREGVTMNNDGFADWIIAFKNTFDHLKRSHGTSCPEPDVTAEFTNNIGTRRHDVNQLMESHNEIETKVNLRLKRVANQLGRVDAHMATVRRNAQLPNSRTRPLKAKTTKASLFLH